MGLFDKKFCDVCGGKIGLLGNRKLEDGNLCKDCASKLSPFFSERRSSTVSDIKEQLAYREENSERLKNFHPTRTFGESTKVYIDTGAQSFIITRASDWRSANPDIIQLSQVLSCNVNIDENRNEIYRENSEGKRESYNPPRYEYDYGFEIELSVNSPWFSTITFSLTKDRVEKYTNEYRRYEQDANEVRMALMPSAGGAIPYAQQPQNNAYGVQQTQNAYSAQQTQGGYGTQPAQSGQWQCSCGTMNTGRFCQNCGSPQQQQRAYFRCDKCGWTPDDPSNPPRFCPQCGDPFDFNDKA